MSSVSSPCYPESWLQAWEWQSHQVRYITPELSNTKPTVVLIHGFGACKEHWRHNVSALASQWDVVALDLVGFGSSSKPKATLDGETPEPGSLRYGIDGWADQVAAFVNEHLKTPVVLVGNSIGGVVALTAAQKLETQGRSAAGVVLVDCAQRAIDDKRVDEQPFGRRLSRPLLKALVKKTVADNSTVPVSGPTPSHPSCVEAGLSHRWERRRHLGECAPRSNTRCWSERILPRLHQSVQ